MKILILITKSNWGGAQRHVYDIATRLPKDAYGVEVMAGGDGPLITKLTEAGVKADGSLPIGRDVSVFEDAKAFFRLCSILRAKRPDVVHLHSSKIGGLGALAARLCGIKKIVFTAHGWAFNENRSFFSKLAIKFLCWITLLLSHETMAVSEAMKRQIMNWPFVSKKVTVVYNGISPEVGFSKTSARHELMNMNPGLKKALEGITEKNLTWIGTVAELHPIKGHEYALRGISELVTSMKQKMPQKKLVYVMMGAGQEKEHLEKLVQDLGISDSVFMLGHVPQASRYISAFDIFLLASLSEGLGYVLLEAGLSHLAVVATVVGGIPEIIDDMKSGVLIQPARSKEICHALEFLITHKSVQRDYGKNLQEKIKSTFAFEKMLLAVVKVYSRPR